MLKIDSINKFNFLKTCNASNVAFSGKAKKTADTVQKTDTFEKTAKSADKAAVSKKTSKKSEFIKPFSDSMELELNGKRRDNQKMIAASCLADAQKIKADVQKEAQRLIDRALTLIENKGVMNGEKIASIKKGGLSRIELTEYNPDTEDIIRQWEFYKTDEGRLVPVKISEPNDDEEYSENLFKFKSGKLSSYYEGYEDYGLNISDGALGYSFKAKGYLEFQGNELKEYYRGGINSKHNCTIRFNSDTNSYYVDDKKVNIDGTDWEDWSI